MNFEYPDGATPLDADEAHGLLLSHITSRGELDRWEQENISEAEAWAFRRKPKDILTIDFLKRMHKRMFGTVWRWAGERRTSGKNIGVDVWQIDTGLQNLCADCAIWIAYGTYPPDEIAARFHHRLTAIHPFPNGNGRHARLMTDILLVHLLGQPRFTWGSGNLVNAGDCRQQYINALRAADRLDYSLLLAFVPS
ncbi:mobile mystery protein B [Trichlorobacter lovleyi]|uniref:mobile mystery protein B n=1 Tax=Trichlorobacter lovleyi TaxID=313985 RepID=UPI002480E127|nr:mobile mystery protein B [Trichlorobacter lovleyi]